MGNDQTVLENYLLLITEIPGTTHFLQERAPCHTSKTIKEFLGSQAFQIIDWPGNSPDLNPTENCWYFMTDKLRGKDIGSLSKLINKIKVLFPELMYHF
jgi:hypothetical protein